jgi:pyruvate-ferredoxin/flavodoxin oxidoreductase
VDKKNRLIRVIPASPLVKASEDRRNFWRMLKSIAGVRVEVDAKQIEDRVRAELAQTLATRLLEIAGDGSAIANLSIPVGNVDAPLAGVPAAAPSNGNGHVAAWIDSQQCTSCDECININPKIFAYDDKKHAYVKDARGGPFKDLVRAAEKCTAQVIHPGTPANSNEKDLAKLIARAEKFN